LAELLRLLVATAYILLLPQEQVRLPLMTLEQLSIYLLLVVGRVELQTLD
jgi:hypothetical protein